MSGFKILLINEKNNRVREFLFRPVIFFLLIFLLGVFLFRGAQHSYGKVKKDVYQESILRIQNENQVLLNRIDQYESELQQILNELETIKVQDNKMRDILKLPKVHEDIRKVGVGGPQSHRFEDLDYLLPENDLNLVLLDTRMKNVHRRVKLEKLCSNDVASYAEKHQNRILAYPAIHPVPKERIKKLSSKFGYRRDPFTRRYTMHPGLDFSARTGTPVYATANGKVRVSRYWGTFGNYIEIDHGYGYRTAYGHLANRKVRAGQWVVRGQRIGSVGNTGRSTASHLHYEVKRNNKRVDPANYIF